MPSREQLNRRARVAGLDPATIQNDSVLEQRVNYLEANADAVTGAVGTGTLTSDTTNVSNNDTVTVDGRVYTFKTTLTGAADEVKIGADAATSLDNLKAAINDSGTQGTNYGVGTTAHTTVTATTNTDTTQVIQSRYKQKSNSITTTEASSHLSWGGATLASGLPAVVAVQEVDAAAVAGGQPV